MCLPFLFFTCFDEETVFFYDSNKYAKAASVKVGDMLQTLSADGKSLVPTGQIFLLQHIRKKSLLRRRHGHLGARQHCDCPNENKMLKLMSFGRA